MSDRHAFKQLAVQQLSEGGILVRFTKRRILSEHVIEQVRQEMQALVAPERLMLLDLSNVEYLSSAALGILITTHRMLRRWTGRMTLCGIPEKIAEVFRICKLDRLFEIYPDLESALAAQCS